MATAATISKGLSEIVKNDKLTIAAFVEIATKLKTYVQTNRATILQFQNEERNTIRQSIAEAKSAMLFLQQYHLHLQYAQIPESEEPHKLLITGICTYFGGQISTDEAKKLDNYAQKALIAGSWTGSLVGDSNAISPELSLIKTILEENPAFQAKKALITSGVAQECIDMLTTLEGELAPSFFRQLIDLTHIRLDWAWGFR
jgi:hypothetical protein